MGWIKMIHENIGKNGSPGCWPHPAGFHLHGAGGLVGPPAQKNRLVGGCGFPRQASLLAGAGLAGFTGYGGRRLIPFACPGQLLNMATLTIWK